MRKVFASLVSLLVIVLWATLESQTVGAQQETPRLKRIRPEEISAGSPSFTLRIDGRHFQSGAKILLNGAPLDSSRVSRNGKLLLADIDPSVVAAPGSHTVQAMNPDGSTSETATLTVVPRDPNLFMRLDGNAAQEDLGLTFIPIIKTDNFGGGAKILGWGKSLTTVETTQGSVAAGIPPNFGTDPASIPITLRDKNGNFSNTEIFFIVPRPARLARIDPDTVEVGTEDFLLKVFGDFKEEAKIIVNGLELETEQRDNGRLEATVPASLCTAPAQLFVRVEQDGIQSVDDILSVAPADLPFIYTIAPSIVRQGEGRTTLDVVGANFDNDSTVTIDGVEARVRGSSRRRLNVLVPSETVNSIGTHDVQVKDGNGNVTEVVSFSVVPDVTVATLAGEREGFNEESCVAAEDVRLRRPRRVILAADGLLYITDNQNHAIRTIDPDTGEVCTIAGTGEEGYNDTGNPADFPPTFSFPNGVAVDSGGSIYVSENGNGVIRRIQRNGPATVVETYAGLFTEIEDKGRQKRLNSTRIGDSSYRDDVLLASGFRQPDDMLFAPDGSLYIADAGNHAIRRINPDGTVETIAGNGVPGFIDGDADKARFQSPTALVLSHDGTSLFVADTNNHRIRRIDLVNKRVETLVGNGIPASVDGPAHVASLSQPIGLALDSDGTLYVAEAGSNGIRRVAPDGNISAFVGGGTSKLKDGTGVESRFARPRGLAIDVPRRILYVADTENFAVRIVNLN